MSIRTKLLLSYIGMTLIPLVLFFLSVLLLAGVFMRDIQGVNEFYDDGGDGKWFLTIRNTFEQRNDLYAGFKFMTEYDPDRVTDSDFLKNADRRLNELKTGLVLVKNEKVMFVSPFLKNAGLTGTIEQLVMNRNDSGEHLTWEGRNYAVAEHHFAFKDESAGTLFLLTDTSPLARLFRKFVPLVLLSLLLVVGLTNGLLTYFVSRSIIKPLYALKRAAEQIREGNLDHEARLKRKDEIGELSAAFEEMRYRLKESIHLQLQYEENRKELLSNISHDLKTPITAIKGCVEGVLDGVADTQEKREKYMNMIYKKAVDMDRLIEELFLFSKLDLKRLPFYFEHFDIAAYLHDCVEELNLNPQMKGVSVTFAYDVDKRIQVVADREKLTRVIMNIVDNSMKYMNKEQKELRFELLEGDTEVTIEIRDNGPGIESEALSHIFDRFYRADQSRNTTTGGSGLGLAIVKQIVEENGGRAWAESKIGEGTAIFFTLRKTLSGGDGL